MPDELISYFLSVLLNIKKQNYWNFITIDMIQKTFWQRSKNWKMKSCQQKLQIYNIHNSY